MIFGIDLGTTNSLIGANDTVYQGLVSSNVDIGKKCTVLRDAVGDDIVSSYKTDMSVSEDGKLPVFCSSVVLKKLAEIGEKCSGEKVRDVVISVPAYFSTSQREAVYKAAEMAGLKLRTLINEPTAAALHVCKGLKDLIVVYDLGGGTFDVSIVDSRVGNYTVVATDGIVLGGDDLDREMMNVVLQEAKIRMRYRTGHALDKLQKEMRLVKENMQRPGVTLVSVNLQDYGGDTFTFTEDMYVECVKKVFGKTIGMTKNIINRNLPVYETPKIVFVGGSTNCPYLKEILKREIDVEEFDCPTPPDYTVALGVVHYAKLLEEGKIEDFVTDVTKSICVEGSHGQSIEIVGQNTNVPCRCSTIVANMDKAKVLLLKLYQGNHVKAQSNEYVGTLEYKYEEEVEAGEGAVEITVEVTADGIIKLSAFEILYGEETRQSISLTAR